MEPHSQVAVSLDELTLHLSEEVGLDNNEYEITSEKTISPATLPKEIDTPFVNLEFILEDSHQGFSDEDHKEEQRYEKRENRIDEDGDGRKAADEETETVTSSVVSNGQERNIEIEPDDFETDEPPLTLFLSQRNDDSDDSEFEVPEPNQAASAPQIQFDDKQKSETGINDVPSNMHKDDEYPVPGGEPHAIDQRVVLDTQIHSALHHDFEPDILTAREKVCSDLPDILLQREKIEHKDVESNEAGLNIQTPLVVVASPKENEEIVNEPEDSDRSYSKPSIVTTAEDWEGVQTVEPGFADPSQQGSEAAPIIESKPLATYSESWEDMAAMDYSSVKDNVKSHVVRQGFSALKHMLFGPPKLQKDLLQERELVFCMAGTAFDNEKEIHKRILQTIYRSLTGSKFDCQRYGGHWEEIGFQGRDPATDLRGTGMLALLHILYFLRDAQTKALARDIYKLSLHPTQNFPFCIMGINITRICLQVFREDVYNKECNKQKNVMGTMNQVYAALFLQLFLLWKKGKTIADSGYVLQEIETYSRKHSKDVFKDLEAYEKKRKQEGLLGEHPENNPAFLDVCKQDKFDNKTPAELY